MKKHNVTIKQDVLFILISSLIVVIAWIGFNLYHISVTSTVDKDVRALLDPIDPTFDRTVINNVKNRNQIEPAFSKQSIAEPTPDANPSAAPTPSNPAQSQPIISQSPAPTQIETPNQNTTPTP